MNSLKQQNIFSTFFVRSLSQASFVNNYTKMDNNTHLKVKLNDGYTDLPGWAGGLIEIGKQSWLSRSEGRQTIIAVSLPSIAHASALVSFGAVQEAVKSDLGAANLELSFEDLKGKVGASVEFKEVGTGKNKKIISRKGVISGVDEWRGQERLMVKYQHTADKVFEKAFYPDEIHSLSILEEQVTENDLQGRGTLLGRASNIPFLSSLLSPMELNELYTPSPAGIRVVDNKSRFKDEVESMDYATEGGDGCLSEIIRPCFLGKYANSSKIDFQSSVKRSEITDKDNVLVLAGAKPITRYIRNKNAGCIVAVLDRTESDNGVAETELNSEFSNRIESLEMGGIIEHNNIRVMAFTRSL